MALKIKQDGLSERINVLMNEAGMTNRRFALSVGIDPSGFDKKTKGTQPWTVNDIGKICEKMKVRKGWLLDGEGQMMKAPDEILDQIPAMPTRSYDARAGVPFFNVEFELGFDILGTDNRNTPDYMIDFKPFNTADCWCTSKGNSMYPTISGGDIIAMKKIEDFHILMNNEIYGIVTVNGLRTIKRVKDNGDTITLIPDNKNGYDEQTIEKKDVMHVFQVLGCIKMF